MFLETFELMRLFETHRSRITKLSDWDGSFNLLQSRPVDKPSWRRVVDQKASFSCRSGFTPDRLPLMSGIKPYSHQADPLLVRR